MTKKKTKKTARKAPKKTRKNATKTTKRKANATKAKPQGSTCGGRKAPGMKCTLHKGHKGTHYDSLKDRSFSKAKKNATKAKPAKRNPAHKREPVAFAVKGRQPKAETVNQAAADVLAILKTYDPVTVHKSPRRAFYPWLVRRAGAVGISPTLTLHAVCKLAERGRVALYVDEDHPVNFAPADRRLLPRMGDTGEPLVWVDVVK